MIRIRLFVSFLRLRLISFIFFLFLIHTFVNCGLMNLATFVGGLKNLSNSYWPNTFFSHVLYSFSVFLSLFRSFNLFNFIPLLQFPFFLSPKMFVASLHYLSQWNMTALRQTPITFHSGLPPAQFTPTKPLKFSFSCGLGLPELSIKLAWKLGHAKF